VCSVHERPHKDTRPSCRVAYLRLNQEVPLRPHMLQEAEHVHRTLILDLLQHAVDHYVGSCPSYTGTVTHNTRQIPGFSAWNNLNSHGDTPAVHQNGSHLLGPGPGRGSDEGQHGQGVFWDAHVRPLGVVVMVDGVFNSPRTRLHSKKRFKPFLEVTHLNIV